jgi:hypothetical protein
MRVSSLTSVQNIGVIILKLTGPELRLARPGRPTDKFSDTFLPFQSDAESGTPLSKHKFIISDDARSPTELFYTA